MALGLLRLVSRTFAASDQHAREDAARARRATRPFAAPGTPRPGGSRFTPPTWTWFGSTFRQAKGSESVSATMTPSRRPARRSASAKARAPPVLPGVRTATWPARRNGAQAWAKVVLGERRDGDDQDVGVLDGLPDVGRDRRRGDGVRRRGLPVSRRTPASRIGARTASKRGRSNSVQAIPRRTRSAAIAQPPLPAPRTETRAGMVAPFSIARRRSRDRAARSPTP